MATDVRACVWVWVSLCARVFWSQQRAQGRTRGPRPKAQGPRPGTRGPRSGLGSGLGARDPGPGPGAPCPGPGPEARAQGLLELWLKETMLAQATGTETRSAPREGDGAKGSPERALAKGRTAPAVAGRPEGRRQEDSRRMDQGRGQRRTDDRHHQVHRRRGLRQGRRQGRHGLGAGPLQSGRRARS